MTDVFITVEAVKDVEIILSAVTGAVLADGIVENTDETYSDTVANGSTLVIPDINITKNDDSVVTSPAAIDLDLRIIDPPSGITFSSTATTVIKRITDAGGTLTDTEEFWLAINFVDKLVASGEWTKMKSLFFVSTIFADATANLVDLISGTLRTASGGFVAFTSGTAPTGGNDSFGIYNRDIIGAKVFLAGGAKIDFSAAGVITYDANQSADKTLAYYASTVALMVTEETSSGQIELFVNGISVDSGAATAGSVSNSFTVPDAIQLFYLSDASADHLDIYSIFENFRTGLLVDKDTPEILYNLPHTSGSGTVYRTSDDRWMDVNYYNHYRKTMKYRRGRRVELSNFITLKENNEFGNLSRFTDTSGNALTPGSPSSGIDHYTGLKYNIVASDTWNNLIDNNRGTILGGSFSSGGDNWHLVTAPQLLSGSQVDKIISLDNGIYHGTVQLFTSTTPRAATSTALRYVTSVSDGVDFNNRAKTSSDFTLRVRKYYI